MKVKRVIVDEMPKSCMVCAYENHSSPFYTNPVCGILFKGIESIKERPSWCPLEVETDGWIAVEESLPKDEKEVLVRTSDGNMWIDLYGIWGDENTASWGDDNVTHWMPLPQPPEVKNELFETLPVLWTRTCNV